MNHRLIASLVLVLVGSGLTVAFGEIPRESREKADYVVTGIVEGVYARDSGHYNHYIVELRVDSVEKGKGLEKTKTLYVSCFRRKASAPQETAATGHELPPKERQRIKAFVKDGKGKHAGIYSDWFDELELARSEN